MTSIKSSLLTELVKDDWVQLEVIDKTAPLWADELWKIRSVREQWATEVYINFLIDPIWDAPRAPGEGIRVVSATRNIPGSYDDAMAAIALIDPALLDKQLMPFIYSLNYYRRTQCVDV